MRFVFISTVLVALGQVPLAAQLYDDHYSEHADHLHLDDHDHAGHSDFEFDRLEPFETHGRGVEGEHGHAGHTSVEGYSFLHGIRTEIDFIERALEFEIVPTSNADDGLVDEFEFEMELVWAINNRTIIIVGLPWITLDPVADPNTSGIGDLELGIQFLAFNGEWSLLFFGLNVSAPIGDEDRDLGAGHSVLEPTALFLYDFGGGTYFQSRLGIEVPVSTTAVGSEFRYDVGLYHSFLVSEDWCRMRFLTPALELNGVTGLNEAEVGETVLDMTAGMRWIVREMDEVGFGVSFPIMGRRDFDVQFLLSYRLHF